MVSDGFGELPRRPEDLSKLETHSMDVQVLEEILVAGRLEVEDVASEGKKVLLEDCGREESRAEDEGAGSGLQGSATVFWIA